MSNNWISMPVGSQITELPKSILPAGAAEDIGAYPFFCSSSSVKKINKWIYDGEFANGIFSGQITFVTNGDVSKVNGGTQIFPILIWFDSNF